MDVPEWLKWVGGGVGGLITGIVGILAGSRLVEKMFGRRWQKDDQRDTLIITNDGKRIDADQNAFNAIMRRLEKVEARVDELQTKLSEEMAKSAGLKAENEALRKENERHTRKLHDFAEKLQQKDAEILNLTQSHHKMELELQKLKAAMEAK